MPLDQASLETPEALNHRFEADAEGGLAYALSGALGRIAMVSSFGAESVVLLHMVAKIAPATPILFVDTLMLFPETQEYQQTVAQTLGLRDVRRIQPDPKALFQRDPDGILHLADHDACCALRKTEVLEAALSGFDIWITGRKRFQGAAREDLALFEADGQRLKVNPLASWSSEMLRAYLEVHGLPKHPLVAKGYPSIGCAPCTTPAGPGEDSRAGRWRGHKKTECGIHVRDGRVIRGTGI